LLWFELGDSRIEQGFIKTVCNKAPAETDEGSTFWRGLQPGEAAKATTRGAIIQRFRELHVRPVVPD
jgi:hypothetical protein